MSGYEICFVTAGDKAVVKKITEALLTEQLAACISSVEKVKSVYRWKGKIEEAEEIIMIIKTRASLREEVMQCVKKNHNYEIPEILFIPAEGSRDYLDWIGANTRFALSEPGTENPITETPETEKP